MAREQIQEQSPKQGEMKHDRDSDAQRSDWQREHKHDRDYEHRVEHMDYEDVSPEQIEADIRRTRAEMDRTLDELQQRLSPRGLWDEVVGIFRKRREKKAREAHAREHDDDGGGAGEMAKKVGRRTLEFVRDHPVPAVLATTAITTLIYESANRRRSKTQGASKIRSINIYRGEPTMYGGSHVHAQSGQPYREGDYGEEVGRRHRGQQQFEFGGEESATERVKRGAKEMSSQFGEKMSHAGESIRGGMHQAGESIRGGMHQAGEAMRSGTHRMREGASNVGEQMKHGMQSAREFVEERPLTVGVGALALGLLVGLLIPRTQREDRIMGEQSEQFMQRSREMGEDLVERGKHVAEEAMEAAAEAASEESERQGLKPE